jgi:hypothetical protein
MKPNPDVRDYVAASVALAETKAANARTVKHYASLYEIREGQDMPQRPELDIPAIPHLPELERDGNALHGQQGGEVPAHQPRALYAGGCGSEDARDCGGVEGVCGGVRGGSGAVM